MSSANETLRSIVDAIDTLELDELRTEERRLERALAFVRGARMGLENLEPLNSVVVAKLIADLRRGFAGDAPVETPPADAAAIAEQDARVAEALANRPDEPAEDNPALADAIRYRNEQAVAADHVGPLEFLRLRRTAAGYVDGDGLAVELDVDDATAHRLGNAWLAPYNGAEEIVERAAALEQDPPEAVSEPATDDETAPAPEESSPPEAPASPPTIVAGVNFPKLEADRTILVDLYGTLGYNVLAERTAAGEFDHELERRTVEARGELGPTPAFLPPAIESMAAPDTLGENAAAIAVPDDVVDPRADWTNDERLLERAASFRGIGPDSGWFTALELADGPEPHGYTSQWGANAIKQRLHLIARGKGNLERPASLEVLVERDGAGKFRLDRRTGPGPFVDDNAGGPGMKGGGPDPVPDGMTPSEYAEEIKAGHAVIVDGARGPHVGDVLGAEDAAAAVRAQDTPAPTALVAKPKAPKRRPEAPPTQNSLEGRILAEFGYKPGTIAGIVQRLADLEEDDRREALKIVARLVDEGELMKAGKENGRTIYAASRSLG